MENGWAFFHFDGDRAWADRSSSENEAKFKERVWDRVRSLIRMHIEERAKEAGENPLSERIDAQATQRMARLKRIVPFYSIEAWLFQNTKEAVRLCELHYSGRDVEQFLEWEQDRLALDEVLKPKKAVCLGSKHNLELASNGFPAREIRAAGKSFAAAVQLLSQDAELREALQQTYSFE